MNTLPRELCLMRARLADKPLGCGPAVGISCSARRGCCCCCTRQCIPGRFRPFRPTGPSPRDSLPLSRSPSCYSVSLFPSRALSLVYLVVFLLFHPRGRLLSYYFVETRQVSAGNALHAPATPRIPPRSRPFPLRGCINLAALSSRFYSKRIPATTRRRRVRRARTRSREAIRPEII